MNVVAAIFFVLGMLAGAGAYLDSARWAVVIGAPTDDQAVGWIVFAAFVLWGFVSGSFFVGLGRIIWLLEVASQHLHSLRDEIADTARVGAPR
jgi:hypothetical protein